jgi:hypothetical protein
LDGTLIHIEDSALDAEFALLRPHLRQIMLRHMSTLSSDEALRLSVVVLAL